MWRGVEGKEDGSSWTEVNEQCKCGLKGEGTVGGGGGGTTWLCEGNWSETSTRTCIEVGKDGVEEE